MLLSWMHRLEQPGAFYSSAYSGVKRKLVVAYCVQIWIDDDGHRTASNMQQKEMVAHFTRAIRRTAKQE